jgi:medium-chain acyl-[acyl-carrier-protein] hydrolase
MPSSAASNNWLFYPEPNSRAKLRLLCFPYAGGRASVFGGWQKWLPSDVELGCVQLPGRDTNRLEPFTDCNSLIRALVPVAGDACTLPLAFFGHSMGTLISFELAREFQTRNWPASVQMFLSGHRAPHQSDSRPFQTA